MIYTPLCFTLYAMPQDLCHCSSFCLFSALSLCSSFCPCSSLSLSLSLSLYLFSLLIYLSLSLCPSFNLCFYLRPLSISLSLSLCSALSLSLRDKTYKSAFNLEITKVFRFCKYPLIYGTLSTGCRAGNFSPDPDP